MNQFPWQLTLGVFVGTLPLLGTIVWALLQNDKRFSRLESQNDKLIEIVADIRVDIAIIKERVTRLEERDRHTIIKG